jgi:predicted GIY-YIG superfamily endonuclease
MKYVYILESLDSRHLYIGITDDLRARLARHNAGATHFEIRAMANKDCVALSYEKQAIAFEKCLKSGSGRAFFNKRL